MARVPTSQDIRLHSHYSHLTLCYNLSYTRYWSDVEEINKYTKCPFLWSPALSLHFQALLPLPQQYICLNDSNKIQDRPQGWSRPEHEVVSISLCCTETTATTKGVLTGCLRKNKHSHNGLWVQFRMIAWYKGHGLSNQKACCFASVFISAIFKWVKEQEAPNRHLINKALFSALCTSVELPIPSSQSSFPDWTAHLPWLVKHNRF